MAKKNKTGKHPHTKHKTIAQIAEQDFPDPDRPKLYTMPNKLIGVNSPDKKEEEIKNVPLVVDQSQYEEMDTAIKEYNNKIAELDPDYTSVAPYQHIIVRCKHLEMTMHGSLFMPINVKVAEVTQNGMGIREMVNSPWTLSTEVIIVSAPDHYKERYPIGSLVQIEKECVIPTKPGIDHDFELRFAYTLPIWYDFVPPKAIDNKHFGYLKLTPDKIIAKLN